MATKKNGVSPRWQKGISGNPSGRPKGARNRVTILAQELLQEDVKDIITAVKTSAKGGDMQAARLILERICPPVKEAPVTLEGMPDASDIEGIKKAQKLILDAVASGDLLPTQAQSVSAILEGYRRAYETHELAAQLEELERKVNK